MLTASPHGPVASREEVVVARYLLFFAVPPGVTAIVLSILDPVLGMTLLAVFSVMWLVLRVVLRQEAFRGARGAVEQPGLASLTSTSAWSDPADVPGASALTPPADSAEGVAGQGLYRSDREHRP